MAISRRHQQASAPYGDGLPHGPAVSAPPPPVFGSDGGRTAAECGHERGHVLDSLFHGQGYATATSRRIFCDRCRLQRWLRVEAALAASQERLGMLAPGTAAQVARACEPGRIDLASLAPEFRRTGHSLVPLLRGLAAACEADSGETVHLGATTQDIQDTAQSLEMRDVLDEADRELAAMTTRLIALAGAHRDSLMVGRTHAQPALPITFGLKVASWLDELGRHGERLAQLRERALVAQLHGGVGTMAGFQGRGQELLSDFAARLGLGEPVVGWHVARDRVAEYGTTLALLTGTLARIAEEIRVLSRAEVGELSEGWEYGRVGSSTMPHKRNPERSEQVVLLARLARSAAALGVEGMVQEHERDARGLRMEWVTVADVSHYTLAALAILNEVLAGLQVHRERMAANAASVAEFLCTEALMLALGERIGKQSAHTLVYAVSQQAQSDGRPLRACVRECVDITSQIPATALDDLLDPARYVGEAGALTDRAVARARLRPSPPGTPGAPRAARTEEGVPS
ncbi:class-II fumarase/aspartase family protein [Streptomyces chrestomyceticus]|uniref:class-II fumarase/aspartase family protein n=1 Tax=Streptomyces chrestomyceticus TaxID=68185 RepID=UPI0019CF98A7|nr:adenylosuccinate lyase family protein [Streptomyces chrestomyceticus]